MNKFFFFAAIVSLAIFSSCADNDIENEVLPVVTDIESTISNDNNGSVLDAGKVDFTINNQNNQVFEKDALLLTNSSENAVSYLWDFGNGDTSTEANPSYTYEKHGTFAVTLTITDKYDNTQEVSHDIHVICLFANQDHGGN